MPTPPIRLLPRLLALPLSLGLPGLAFGAERVALVDLIDEATDEVVVRTHSDAGAAISAASVELRDPATGEAFESVSMDTPSRSFAVLHGGDAAAGDTVDLTLELPVLAEDGSPTGETWTATASLDGVSTERTAASGGGGGYTISIWITPRGKLRARVSSDNDGWRGQGLGAVTSTIGGASEALSLDRVVDVWRSPLDTDLSTVASLDLATEAVDAEGSVLATARETVFTDTSTVSPTLVEQRVRETRRGVARTLVTTRGEAGQIAALEVELADTSTGALVLDAVVEAPDSIDRTYYAGLELEDDPNEDVYLVLLDFLDAEGRIVGAQLEVELTAPAIDEETVTYSGVFLDAAQESSISLWHGPDDGFGLVVDWAGDDVQQIASVDVTFEEPFEGPPPLETTVNLPLRVERANWSVRGSEALPAAFTVTTRTLDAEGEVLSVVQSGGDEPGVTYKNDDPKPKKWKKPRRTREQEPIVISKPLDCQLCSS